MRATLKLRGDEYAIIEYSLDYNVDSETVMAAKEYEWEHFPDKYGGVTIPAPKGPRKPTQIVHGKTASGEVTIDGVVRPEKVTGDDGVPEPVTLTIETDDATQQFEDAMVSVEAATRERTKLQFVASV